VLFQKISIPTPWMVIGISKGWGISKTKLLTKRMKLKGDFWSGGGGGGHKLWIISFSLKEQNNYM